MENSSVILGGIFCDDTAFVLHGLVIVIEHEFVLDENGVVSELGSHLILIEHPDRSAHQVVDQILIPVDEFDVTLEFSQLLRAHPTENSVNVFVLISPVAVIEEIESLHRRVNFLHDLEDLVGLFSETFIAQDWQSRIGIEKVGRQSVLHKLFQFEFQFVTFHVHIWCSDLSIQLPVFESID